MIDDIVKGNIEIKNLIFEKNIEKIKTNNYNKSKNIKQFKHNDDFEYYINIVISNDERFDINDKCEICNRKINTFDYMNEYDIVIKLECNHYYHLDCFYDYILCYNNQCFKCKKELKFELCKLIKEKELICETNNKIELNKIENKIGLNNFYKYLESLFC
uniref:RING-type domain-containing protein n=1 Tax=Pithovirus LCDPAC02 TaxID=2506601 RepID=A0A481YRR8_9VIRU|nr:MAG: hypothetical protein LCDPAC02_03450 [Pithovirus LCDPAC02]